MSRSTAQSFAVMVVEIVLAHQLVVAERMILESDMN